MCQCKTKKKPFSIEQTVRNGVRVRITRWADGGTSVETDCWCLGYPCHTHSTVGCPLLQRQMRQQEVA
jgi:hypothetical protein